MSKIIPKLKLIMQYNYRKKDGIRMVRLFSCCMLDNDFIGWQLCAVFVWHGVFCVLSPWKAPVKSSRQCVQA